MNPDIIDVESLADVDRYQCFTFPEEPGYDLRIDQISMKKMPRDDSDAGRRWAYSEEECELGPQVYTLKILAASEGWGQSVDNMQATIVFSGNPKEQEPELSESEYDPGVDKEDYGGDSEEDEGDPEDDLLLALDADLGPEAGSTPVDPVQERDSSLDEYFTPEEDFEALGDEYDEFETEPISDDFVVDETDEFLLHNLKHIGKVECIFVTRATDEIWQFHEIRVTRVKPAQEKPEISAGEKNFKPVSKLYRRSYLSNWE